MLLLELLTTPPYDRMCHENTRIAIMEEMSKWARRTANELPFLWMYGPAWCGKTTIVQTVAEQLDSQGTLAASFFFSRPAPGRSSTKNQFLITISYQMSLALPDTRPQICNALTNNPTIFDKALIKQAKELIIKPLNAFA